MQAVDQKHNYQFEWPKLAVAMYYYYILSRTALHTTKYIHQRDSPLVRLLGGEGTIPKSTQYVTVVTDTTQ